MTFWRAPTPLLVAGYRPRVCPQKGWHSFSAGLKDDSRRRLKGGGGHGYAGAIDAGETDAIMRRGRAGFLVGASALLCVSTLGTAASFNCSARGLSLTAMAICRNPQLSRVDEQMARRVDGFAHRLNYGQYLGLRFWQSSQVRGLERCGADIICLGTAYRAQMRFLDRLQQCLDTSAQRRACLRTTLSAGHDAREQHGGTGGRLPYRTISGPYRAWPRRTPS
jgi:uncharacterized protein